MHQPAGFKVHFNSSLQFKIPAVFLGLFVLILLAFVAVLNTVGKQLIEEQAYLKISKASQNVITDLEKRTIIAATLSDALANLAETLPPDNSLNQQLFLQLLDYKGTESFIAGGGVWPAPFKFAPTTERRSFFWGRDPHGELQYYDDYNNPDGLGYHHEEWYVPGKYLSKGENYWSKSYIDPYSHQPMVTVSSPMFRNGKNIGVATVDLKLEGLQSLLEQVTHDFGGYAFAVDRNGTLLSFPDHTLATKSLNDNQNDFNKTFINIAELAEKLPLFKPFSKTISAVNDKLSILIYKDNSLHKNLPLLLAEESYQIKTEEAKLIAASITNASKDNRELLSLRYNFMLPDDYFFNESAYVSVITMPQTFWKIITVMPYSAAISKVTALHNQFLLATLSALLIALLIMWLLLKKVLISPIKNLAKQLQNNAQENSFHLLASNDQSELGALTYWFNKRSSQLMKAQQLLTHAHTELEQRVIERTKELTRTNQQFEEEIKAHKKTESTLMENEALLSKAQSIAHIASWRWDLKNNKLWWSDEAYRICGLEPRSVNINIDFMRRIIHPDDLHTVKRAVIRAISKQTAFGAEYRIIRPNGETRYIQNQGEVYNDFAGNILEIVGTSIDISERKQTEAELRLAAATFETHDAIMITDKNSRILKVNNAFTEITGYTPNEVVGKDPKFFSSGQHDNDFYQRMWTELLDTGRYEGEIWNRRKNGDIYPLRQTITATRDEQDQVTHYVCVFSDITEQKNTEEQIRNLAFYDPLTELPNRRLLLDRLEHELAVASRNKHFGSILFLDLDRFKLINDALGHQIGDELLIQVAQRLTLCLRKEDTASRLGGDEFVVMTSVSNNSATQALQQALTVAEKIQLNLGKPYELKGHEHHITPSIGITIFPDSYFQPVDLLKQADTAMYQAKEDGRNSICFYNPKMQKKADNRLKIEKELRTAIAQEQLTLMYQPQVDGDENCLGAEALVRWRHSTNGIISPDKFIAVAEDSGLIIPLGNWVINEVCRQLKEWQDHSIKSIHLAINVSPRQFRHQEFLDTIRKAIKKHQISPQHLVIELTEGIVISDIEDTVKKMQALKAMGIGISIDDFGTGYSSLTYLKQLPLDQLKIDQSFVRDINTDPNDAIIVQTIIAMATHLGLNVIAEGVETAEQKLFLVNNGCPQHQGYYYSRPLPSDEFETFLELN